MIEASIIRREVRKKGMAIHHIQHEEGHSCDCKGMHREEPLRVDLVLNGAVVTSPCVLMGIHLLWVGHLFGREIEGPFCHR
jgi:hypothetical protein